MGVAMPTTRYALLAEELRLAILSGEATPGSLLATEEELCRLHQVSRTTVREALRLLAYEGLVLRQQGRGTVVVGNAERAAPAYHSSSPIDAILQYKPGALSEMEYIGRFTVPAWIQAKSISALKGRWIKFAGRVVSPSTENAALSAVDIYMRPDMDKVIESINHNKSLFFREIHDVYGIQLKRVEQVIEATRCGTRSANILLIKRRDPCLRIIRKYYDQSDMIFAISISDHSGNNFAYFMDIDVL